MLVPLVGRLLWGALGLPMVLGLLVLWCPWPWWCPGPLVGLFLLSLVLVRALVVGPLLDLGPVLVVVGLLIGCLMRASA